MKAVIPAAGLGTRFLPATKSQPKEMLPIVDKPVLHYVVEEVVEANINAILMITGRSKRAIVDYFDKSLELEHHLRDEQEHSLDGINNLLDKAHFYFVRQKEPLGLGHAISCSHRFVGNEPFVVLLGDDIIIDECVTSKLITLHEKLGVSIIAVEEVPDEKTKDYGIITGEELEPGLFRVSEIVEKPKPGTASSNLAIVGRYLFTPEIFDCIDQVKPGLHGEIQLTDAISLLNQKQEIPWE